MIHAYSETPKRLFGRNVMKIGIGVDNIGVTRSGRSSLSGPPTTAPINLTSPSISGTAQVGETLSVTNGTWDDGGEAISGYTYQWLADDVNISGATSSTYELTSNELGAVITCTVTATNAIGSTAATSAGTDAVADATGIIWSDDFESGSANGSWSATSPMVVDVLAGGAGGSDFCLRMSHGGTLGTQTLTGDMSIPAGLRGSSASLNLSFDVGDFSSEGNDNYFWETLDSELNVTELVTGSWAGPENTYETFAHTGLALPADAETLRLRVVTTKTGIGGQSFDTRVDNILAELTSVAANALTLNGQPLTLNGKTLTLGA